MIFNKNANHQEDDDFEDVKFTKIKLDFICDAINKTMDNPEEGSQKNNNKKDSNDQITIKFNFSKDDSIFMKAKPYEKFDNVVQRLKEEKPEVINKYAPVAIHNCKLINFEKTLSENNIKDGDYVLFFRQIKNENDKEHLDEDEKEQLKKWLDEYKSNKLCEYYAFTSSVKDEKELREFELKLDKDEFIAFVLFKEREVGINVREHEHRLVYCITKFDWKCNKCNKNYSKNEAKYYCSFCDYYMCDNCREKGYYDKKRKFPKNIPPNNVNFKEKFLKCKHHEHNLALCRTSRIVLSETYWKCNICKKGYNYNDWSFYCTKCDFDLCCNCAGIH